jgi:hypothetical protein
MREAHEPYIRRRLGAIVDEGCRVFGMLLLDGNARMAAWVSKLIKELCPEAHVVVGGPGSTSLYRLRRRYRGAAPVIHPVEVELAEGHAFDSWALGEGEQTLLELLTRLERGEDLHGLRGLALTADGPLAPFRERALIKDLNTLPHATFEGFDLGLYEYRAMPFQLSRGCAYARCSHCGLRGYSRGFRVRSADHAIAEIRHHIETYGIREFHFSDMGVNGDLEQLEAFCDEVLRQELDIRWQSFVEIRSDMTPELLRKIVASGCTSLNYGFESGSDRVLKLMRKAYTAAEAAEVLRLTREAGGRTIINLMVGHPGETEEDLQQTLDFLTRNADNITMVASVAGTGVHMHSPLLDEREAFGVVLEEDGSWHSTDGAIDTRVRNERVSRVTEHCRLQGIACFEAFWETTAGETRHAAPEVAVIEATEERGLEITRILVAGPYGELGAYRVDLPLIVNVGYRARGVPRAIFDLELTDLWGRTAFATPEAAASVRVVDLHPEGWVRMVLSRYDLMPGPLLVAARARGVAPDPPATWDRHLLRAPVELLGSPRDRTPVLTPYSWTNHQGRLAAPHDDPFRQLRIMEGPGAEPLRVSGDVPLTVWVALEPLPFAQAELRLRVIDGGGRVVLQGPRAQLDLRGGEAVWTWFLEEPRLEPGAYVVELELETEDGPHGSRVPLQVGGAGVGWAELSPYEVSWAETAGGEVELEGADRPVAPGSELTLRLPAGGPGESSESSEPSAIGVQLLDTEHCVVARLVERARGRQATLRFHLNLLDGSYRLRCGRWDPARGRLVEPARELELEVRSDSRRAGGGLVYAPHRLWLPTR